MHDPWPLTTHVYMCTCACACSLHVVCRWHTMANGQRCGTMCPRPAAGPSCTHVSTFTTCALVCKVERCAGRAACRACCRAPHGGCGVRAVAACALWRSVHCGLLDIPYCTGHATQPPLHARSILSQVTVQFTICYSTYAPHKAWHVATRFGRINFFWSRIYIAAPVRCTCSCVPAVQYLHAAAVAYSRVPNKYLLPRKYAH